MDNTSLQHKIVFPYKIFADFSFWSLHLNSIITFHILLLYLMHFYKVVSLCLFVLSYMTVIKIVFSLKTLPCYWIRGLYHLRPESSLVLRQELLRYYKPQFTIYSFIFKCSLICYGQGVYADTLFFPKILICPLI